MQRLLFFVLLLAAVSAEAAVGTGTADTVLDRFLTAAKTWSGPVKTAATGLFLALAGITLSWRLLMLGLERAVMESLFVELTRWILTTGFFWWVLLNGPAFAVDIIDSFRQIGGQASGTAGLSPSTIIDVGLDIMSRPIANASGFHPIDTTAAFLISMVILAVLALIGGNILVTLCTAWFLTYAGQLLLGFGGSNFTQQIAVGYLRSVLDVGIRLFVMSLLVGLATSVVVDMHAAMAADAPAGELAALLVASLVLWQLVDKLPAALSAMSLGGWHGNVGNHGGASALGTVAAAWAGTKLATGVVATVPELIENGVDGLKTKAVEQFTADLADIDKLAKENQEEYAERKIKEIEDDIGI